MTDLPCRSTLNWLRAYLVQGGLGAPAHSRTLSHQQQSPHQSNNDSAAGSFQGSAVTTAAAGMPPEPHERDAGVLMRPRPLGSCADRMARYKVIRQCGAARNLRGDHSKRDARLRYVEGSDVSYANADRTRDAVSQPARVVLGWSRLKQRVEGIA